MVNTPEWALEIIKEAEEKGLTELNLMGIENDKELLEFPESITRLSNLERLYLSSNKLTELPESIGHLKNLVVLDLGFNQLLELPKSIGRLTNLTTLFLEENQLSELPKSITRLSNLLELDLSHNQLTELPESIGRLTNLFDLELDDNPITTPPPEVIEKGIDAIREYFKQLKNEGVDYIFEAKLLILGAGAAGKTTLAEKILNPDYELKKEGAEEAEKTTEGIDVSRWEFPVTADILEEKGCEEVNKKFRVNIWDFGGQEIYHSTHQFFLTKRSLYLIVADDRKEDTDYDYWFKVVTLLSDGSPLLLIKNEKQGKRHEIDELRLRGEFDNFKESLRTNLSTNEGLTEIISSIRNHLCSLPQTGTTLPKTWVKVRKALDEDGRDYIGQREYFEICQKYGFTDRNDKLQLSAFLHDIGVCLHFQRDPVLESMVILNPKWGTDAVYKVLDNKTVLDRHGRFTRDDLTNIWSETEYNDMHSKLLQLMVKFELCYRILDTDSYIAPQLLGPSRPESICWDDTKNIFLRYEYEFMPKGIITRLIVALHEMIPDEDNVWRSGVMLATEHSTAEVIEHFSRREITIRISGELKRDLMTIIVTAIDKINDTFKGLKISRLIPCNCEECNLTDTSIYYEYDELLERLRNEKYEIECRRKPYNTVNVFGLTDKVLNIRGKTKGDEKREDRIDNPRREGKNQPSFIIDARTYVKAEQHQKASTSVDIDIFVEIKNEIKGLKGDFDLLKEDMLDSVADDEEAKVLGKELDRVDKAVENLENFKAKEEAASSSALKRIGAFIKKLDNTSTKAGKAVKAVENGIGYAQNIAKKYNKIAQWCGMPTVPDLFLKKDN